VVGIIIYLLTGRAPQQVTAPVQQPGEQTQTNYHGAKGSMENFASIVLAETEVVWDSLFQANGMTYQKPILHLFNGQVVSACGLAGSATGPFYCPEDQKVYLDVSFFRELKDRFGAPGDFANAYVIAHEIGHHVQYLLGTTQKMARYMHETGAGSASVAMELQADFYAGVWAHFAEKMNSPDNPVVIEPGDIDAALRAANAIGDDRLQKMTRGQVMPDAFTHGTSQQRMYWFKKGYETGDIRQGNTFKDVVAAALN
jgi:predicted metalloprotease